MQNMVEMSSVKELEVVVLGTNLVCCVFSPQKYMNIYTIMNNSILDMINNVTCPSYKCIV